MSDRIADIRARLDAVIGDGSSMPWSHDDTGECVRSVNGREIASVPFYDERDLMAHAPDDLTYLLDELDRARKWARAWRVMAWRADEYWRESEGYTSRPGYPAEAQAHDERKRKRIEAWRTRNLPIINAELVRKRREAVDKQRRESLANYLINRVKRGNT